MWISKNSIHLLVIYSLTPIDGIKSTFLLFTLPFNMINLKSRLSCIVKQAFCLRNG